VEIGIVVALDCRAVGRERFEFVEGLGAADVTQVPYFIGWPQSIDERVRQVVVRV
jgi:hypothetical protein